MKRTEELEEEDRTSGSFQMLRLRSLIRLASAGRMCLSADASSAALPKVDKEV
uniref:Uncharacterized protein n=1 Tax=Ascaris lumbricoides TaxID=6252 RepID=A0A0M3I6C4_ASCLU